IMESHVEMDGAWALYEAWVKILTGEADVALAYGFGKSSAGELRRGRALPLDPCPPPPPSPRSVGVAGAPARLGRHGGARGEAGHGGRGLDRGSDGRGGRAQPGRGGHQSARAGVR